MFRKIIKVERDMLITKGGVSFRGQPELLKWSGISSFGSSDLTISLIFCSPCLSISLGKKNNNNNHPQTVIREVRVNWGEKQYCQKKSSFRDVQINQDHYMLRLPRFHPQYSRTCLHMRTPTHARHTHSPCKIAMWRFFCKKEKMERKLIWRFGWQTPQTGVWNAIWFFQT